MGSRGGFVYIVLLVVYVVVWVLLFVVWMVRRSTFCVGGCCLLLLFGSWVYRYYLQELFNL